MQIVTTLNAKGGVGKSTTASHLAAGLALRGHRVVLIDTDPQGHGGMALGIPKSPGLYNLLIRDYDWEAVLSPTTYPNLSVLPSNNETAVIPLSINDVFKLDTRLRTLAVDYIIIDTPPTVSLLNASILITTDHVLYPTEPEYFSIQGLLESQSYVAEMNHRRAEWNVPPVNVLGILPTMFRRGVLEHADNLAALQRKFGENLVWSPVRLLIAWAEASRDRRPVWDFAPDSEAACDAYEILDRFEKEISHVAAQSS